MRPFLSTLAFYLFATPAMAGSFNCTGTTVDLTGYAEYSPSQLDLRRTDVTNPVYDMRGETFYLHYSAHPGFPIQAGTLYCAYSGSDALPVTYARQPVRVAGAKADSTTICLQGGLHTTPTGKRLPVFSRNSSEWTQKSPTDTNYCNSANINADGFFPTVPALAEPERPTIIEGVRIHNAWDGIKIGAAACETLTGGHPTHCKGVIRNAWISEVADDCIEADVLPYLDVRNVLCDGVFDSVSATGTKDAGEDKSISTTRSTFQHFYVRLKGGPRRFVDNGETPFHYGPWKFYLHAPKWTCNDCVIAFQFNPRNPTESKFWNEGWDKYDRNAPGACVAAGQAGHNYVLYLGTDTLTGYFSNPETHAFTSGCWTLKTGAEAARHWNTVRNRFISEHPDLMRAPGDPPVAP